MKRKGVRWAVGSLIVLIGAIAAVAGGKSPQDIPAGTGYSAWDVCSRTHNSREPITQVRSWYLEPKVAPLPLLWNLTVESERVTVSTWLPTQQHPRTAIHRAGLGCTLLPPGTNESSVRTQPFVPITQAALSSAPWPNGEGQPERERLDERTLATIEAHMSDVFGETSQKPAERQNTTALLIAREGHLVFERYAQGHTRDDPQLGWSMTKSLTALIAGTLARDGLVTLDAPVGLPQWSASPKREITWRQLLNMAPGLAWFEGYGGASDATQMLFSQADQGAWAADRPLTSTPGSVFTYSTGFSNVAMLRLRQLLGGTHQALYDHYQRQLLAPLGVRNAVIEADASGTPVGGARGFLRPVDWLRLGQLVANGGRWNGATILPAAWVAYMVAASPAATHYGGSLWRVAGHPRIDPLLRKRLPPDTVFFAGHMGQFTIIVPSQQLVVLRMGASLTPHEPRDIPLHHTLGLVADLLGV